MPPRGSTARGFDRLAPLYAGLEYAAFGGLLARARGAFLDDLGRAERVLILGEGDGRFLVRLLGRNPRCRVTCLDSSAGMLRRARARVARSHPEALARVTFWHRDALTGTLPAASYDAVVTLFFLDVFTAPTLAALVPALERSLRPGGCWLLADFAAPSGPLRLYRLAWLRLLYGFFRLTTGIEARALVNPLPLLQRAGLHAAKTRRFHGGFFHGGFVYATLLRKRDPALPTVG